MESDRSRIQELSLHVYERTTDEELKIVSEGIRIDSESLIDLIEKVEKPFAVAEGAPILAGWYTGRRAEDLFGSPTPLLTEGELILLDCGCDVLGCLPLWATVRFDGDTVVWSGFHQPHRGEDARVPWNYGDRKFVFDRTRYFQEVRRIQEEFRRSAGPNSWQPGKGGTSAGFQVHRLRRGRAAVHDRHQRPHHQLGGMSVPRVHLPHDLAASGDCCAGRSEWCRQVLRRSCAHPRPPWS